MVDRDAQPDLNASVQELLDRHGDVLADYEAERARAQRFAEAEANIEALNNAVSDEGLVLVNEWGSGAGARVYRFDSKVQGWVERSSIETMGAGYPFVGDRLDVVDGRLVLTNFELQLGMEVKGTRVRPKTPEELAQFRLSTRFDELLTMIEKSPIGEHTQYDCMWP